MTTSIAIVTGGGSGIGAATVRRLAKRGLDVVIADRNLVTAQAVADEVRATGGQARAVACDVTKSDEVDSLITGARAGNATIDLLVNCAGLAGRSGRVDELSADEWRSVIDVNLASVMLTARAIGPVMYRQRSGSIVNVASIAGLRGSRGQVAYSGAKAGVIGVTMALAKELMGAGVRVNAVAPGFIATPMTDSMPEQIRQAWRLEDLVLGGGFGTADQVAACIDFLGSEAASFVTGVTLPVDGGFTLGYP